MPQALWSRDPNRVSDELVRKLIPTFQILTARALSCMHGELKPEDIMVEVRNYDPLDAYKRDLQIMIISLNYPHRVTSIQSRTEEISDGLQKVMPDSVSFFVFPILAAAGFVAVSRRDKSDEE